MQLGSFAGLHSLQHFLDQIDPSTRAIQLITKHQVAWTSCRTETAMHAATHDVGCNTAIRTVMQVFRQLYFHCLLARALDRDGPD